MPLTIADHILFGIIAIALPALAIFRVRRQVASIPSDTRIKIKLYWLNSAVLWGGAVVVLIVWWLSDRSFASMGWALVDNRWFPEWMITIAVFVLFYMFDTFVAWNSVEENPAAALLPMKWKEFAHFGTIVSISAAVCEEIVFRGFMITYLIAVLPEQPWTAVAAIAISSVIFAALHAYQGFWASIKITFLAMLFGIIFVLTDSLIPVIILHFLVDFTGGLVALFSVSRDAPGFAGRA